MKQFYIFVYIYARSALFDGDFKSFLGKTALNSYIEE